MKASRPTSQNPTKSATLIGLGFDAADGHTRLTRGKNFVLAGGSEETHGVMQETAIKLNETLDRQGRRLEEVSSRGAARHAPRANGPLASYCPLLLLVARKMLAAG